jgi:hypothetical protein
MTSRIFCPIPSDVDYLSPCDTTQVFCPIPCDVDYLPPCDTTRAYWWQLWHSLPYEERPCDSSMPPAEEMVVEENVKDNSTMM